jgi:hypothetical protein
MVKRDKVDGFIQAALRDQVVAQEPASEVRASLLTKAEAQNAEAETVVGASIPPLATGLRETRPVLQGAAHLPGFEVDLLDLFGAAQQRLIAVWLLSNNTRY